MIILTPKYICCVLSGNVSIMQVLWVVLSLKIYLNKYGFLYGFCKIEEVRAEIVQGTSTVFMSEEGSLIRYSISLAH